jgi:hypothetical protein
MPYYNFKVDEYTIYIYHADEKAKILFTEALHRGVPMKGPYSLLNDKPQTNGSKFNLHMYYKRNNFFALNKDGTSYNGNKIVKIPDKVVDAIRYKFQNPGFSSNGTIESVSDNDGILIEILID